MILSNSGQLLWYSDRGTRLSDLKTVHYRGRTLLAFFQERLGGRRSYELLDSRYRVVGRIEPSPALDSHELQLTPRGTAYVGGYVTVTVAGRGPVVDYLVREIDVKSGAVLFEWHALHHVPVSATYVPQPRNGQPWDYFHGNSIEPPRPGGDTIIVSARNTSAIYGIDRATGAIRWTLGGKGDQFGLAREDPNLIFCAQHDARRLPNGDITLFDNGGSGKGAGTGCPLHAARVLQFRLDAARRSVRLVRSISSRDYTASGAGYFPRALGTARCQPNGDTLISWGDLGAITQVSRRGRVTHGLKLGSRTYRAVRARWVGRPPGRPAIAARRRADGSIDVWASWNGATEIARWTVLAGPSPRTLRPVGRRFRFADLETRMRIAGPATYVAVRALNAQGHQLGRSRAQPVRATAPSD